MSMKNYLNSMQKNTLFYIRYLSIWAFVGILEPAPLGPKGWLHMLRKIWMTWSCFSWQGDDLSVGYHTLPTLTNSQSILMASRCWFNSAGGQLSTKHFWKPRDANADADGLWTIPLANF
jgi:hypothetical protein